MNPLMLMILFHVLSSRGLMPQGMGQPQMGQKPGMAPSGPGAAPAGGTTSGHGKQLAQGPHGAVAAHHGQMGPVAGGVPQMLNMQGALPHQQPMYTPRAKL